MKWRWSLKKTASGITQYKLSKSLMPVETTSGLKIYQDNKKHRTNGAHTNVLLRWHIFLKTF
jgi:hypothetical protein